MTTVIYFREIHMLARFSIIHVNVFHWYDLDEIVESWRKSNIHIKNLKLVRIKYFILLVSKQLAGILLKFADINNEKTLYCSDICTHTRTIITGTLKINSRVIYWLYFS